MRRVLKYEVFPYETHVVTGGDPVWLHVSFQTSRMFVWAEVDESGSATHRIRALRTGDFLPMLPAHERLVFIGTASTFDDTVGELVFHMYVVAPNP